MLAVKGGTWVILGGAIGACHSLKQSEEDVVEIEGVSDALEVTTLVDGVESSPES